MDNYEHLSSRLRAARGGRSRREIADATGVAENTITRYESGSKFRGVPTKMRKLADFYRWSVDSIDACLRGEEPTVIPHVPKIPALTLEARALLIEMVGASDLPAWGRGHLLRVLLEGGDHIEDTDLPPRTAAGAAADPTAAQLSPPWAAAPLLGWP